LALCFEFEATLAIRARNGLAACGIFHQTGRVTLLEREPELAAIEAVLQHCGRMLLIEGGMGLGKTSLVEAGCARAEELGYNILRSRGFELEADFAFGVVCQLFERRLREAPPEDRDALLAGPAAAVWPLLVSRLLRISGP
jgi:hypothetical protein